MTLPLWLRRLVRPLVPDPIMARLRLAEHSRQVRTNVDVVVDDPREQRRWLSTTPDTYRVRPTADFPPGPPGDDPVVLTEDHPAGDRLGTAERAALLHPLGDPRIDAAVLAVTTPPRLVGRRRTEPRVGPRAVAARRHVLDELGDLPAEGTVLPVVHERLRAAGARLALVPGAGPAGSTTRDDPIAAPSLVVLALVPMHDVGGGSRGAQLAQEFLRRGWHVTYAALYGTAESTDLGIRHLHPRLEQHRVQDLDLGALTARVRSETRVTIVEAPAAPLVDRALELSQHGYRTVYDLIDDWEAPSLGAEWYRRDEERRLIAAADALTASAPALRDRLADHGREVVLVPNAVDLALFGTDPGALPPDLPSGGGPLFGYHGSLYGDWFDWPALAAVAAARPDATLAVIGDVPATRPALPGNVVFLGLKPQVELPAYVGRFDVGLLPFVVSPVTHAVSPLKVYEYLAAGVPVAAPPLETLRDLPGVATDPDLPAAVDAALAGPRPRLDLRAHSWGARVDAILAAVGVDDHGAGGDAARVVLRPAVHYGRSERRVTSRG